VIVLVKSMTGYGRKVMQQENYSITVEIRSVNNRYLDINLKMPRSLLSLEEEIKKIIRSSFQRGKLDIYITTTGEANFLKKLEVDWELLEQYMEAISEIKGKYQIDGNLSASALLNIPEIFSVFEMEKSDRSFKENLLISIKEASREMLEMRKAEGAFLEKDILMRLDTLDTLTVALEELRPLVIKEYQERILKRMNVYLDNNNEIDDARLHQEIAILSEKGEITEELVRMKSHIEHMRKTLQEEGSVGRKLDFICQEMHREANTIGAKSSASEISQIDVQLKSEIEKIKEQVQNIE